MQIQGVIKCDFCSKKDWCEDKQLYVNTLLKIGETIANDIRSTPIKVTIDCVSFLK